MADSVNRQWILNERPQAKELPTEQHLKLVEGVVPEPAEGEFLLRTICLGTSPAQRSYTSGGLLPHAPVQIGDVMRGRGVGEVIESRNPDFKPGDIVVGSTGWQDYSVLSPSEDFVWSMKKVRHPVRPLTMALGILGNAGATAWFGLLEAAAMQSGDVVVITAAAGGVGSVAGQIARLKGAAKVVGITGSDAKCAWLVNELGYDAAINYHDGRVAEALAEHCPEGIDVCLDNVGGEILNAVLGNLAMHARIAIAGAISTEYETGEVAGPLNYRNLVVHRARMQGFVVFDYWQRFAEAEDQLYDWYQSGTLVNCEDIVEGLEKMPGALADLFSGGNCGIRSVRVSPDPD